MKTQALCILLLSLTLAGCRRDEDFLKELEFIEVLTLDPILVDTNQIRIRGRVSGLLESTIDEFGFIVESKNPDASFVLPVTSPAKLNSELDTFSLTWTAGNLASFYEIYAFAKYAVDGRDQTFFGDRKVFAFRFGIFLVNVKRGCSYSKLEGVILRLGQKKVEEEVEQAGFVYGSTPDLNITTNDTLLIPKDSINEGVVFHYDTLFQNGDYYVRAFMVWSGNVYYSLEEINFSQYVPIIDTILLSADSTCPGSDVTLTAKASGGDSLTYIWDNVSSEYDASYTLTLDQTKTIDLIVTNSLDCSATRSVTVPVYNPLIAMAHAEQAIVCEGASTTLSVTISGGKKPFQVEWVPALDSNGEVWPVATTTYRVNVTDACNRSSASQITVAVPDPLRVAITGKQEICQGESATLTASVTGGRPDYTYEWSNGATGKTIHVAETETYTVKVADACGKSAEASLSVTVFENPTVTVTAAPGTTFPSNTSVTLSASASGGSGNYQYTWTWDQQTRAGRVITETVSATTSFTVSVTDGKGCTGSAEITITIQGSGGPPPPSGTGYFSTSGPLPESVTAPHSVTSGSIAKTPDL